MKILSDRDEASLSLHPLDRHYSSLRCALRPLDEGDADLATVRAYIASTHGRTHSQYTMEVEEVFAVEREGEGPRFRDVGNRTLLFHGSRLSNYAGILGQGLRIAPPEAPPTGYMFGGSRAVSPQKIIFKNSFFFHRKGPVLCRHGQ